jgi:hypothetical protein
MSRHLGLHRSSRRVLLIVIAFLVLMALLSAGPVSAHTFTKIDGNDSPSKIDLKAVSVSHTSNSVVHKVQTYNAWTPASLQHDSFFVIQIDKNNDRRYERCAFIFYTSRLRGSLSNCGAQFIRYLPVAKLSGTTARITIPKSQLGGVYWWAAVSYWDGPAPCGNGCVDFSPNRFPDILHDLTPPTVSLPDTQPISIWETSTVPTFAFPFTVNDANTSVTWQVQHRALGLTAWTTVANGSGEGAQSPSITGVDPGVYDFRVVAVDAHGNKKTSRTRTVWIPTDDSDVSGFTNPSEVLDDQAYGGSYQEMDAFTIELAPIGGSCWRPLVVIGPGGGDWEVTVTATGLSEAPINGNAITSAPRQTLFSRLVCAPSTVTFTQTGGAERFGIDAVLI